MKRFYLALASLVAPLAVASCANQTPSPARAADEPQRIVLPDPIVPVLASHEPGVAPSAPATQPVPQATPALPAGHPDISQMTAQQPKPGGQLPAGHPDLSAMTGGGTSGMPAMPPGHPDISQMNRPASTQPSMIGSLRIRAVQGTAGGPPVGALPVVVELYQGENLLDKNETKLAADGTLTLDNIPVGMVVTPIVRVTYNGVDYTTSGGVMDGRRFEQRIQVPVFETTEEQPVWNIRMQHVMLQPTTAGVQVVEMLAIENPGDRTWIGKLGADNKRSTLAIALPQGAKDVQLAGGFHECCVKVEGEKITNSMAFVPGTTQYQIGYTLPVSSGKADIAFATPAPVKHLMIFVPNDGTTVAAEGVASSGVADMGGGKTRFYKAADLAAGATIKLGISGITASAAAPTQQAAASAAVVAAPASGQIAKLVAGVGGLAIFVVGGMLLLLKGPKAKKA